MLTEQNIEAELSYAYLHAIASKVGFACEYTTRHMDSVAVDAIVREEGRFLASNSVLGSFEAHLQLKATYRRLKEIKGRWSFSLPLHQYNRLREPHVQSSRILVVMQLPANPKDWLRHSEEALVAKRCAYWVSLRGAPASANREGSVRIRPAIATALARQLDRPDDPTLSAGGDPLCTVNCCLWI